MKKKHTLIKGTLLLTMTGFASRIIGFYYRIFLSRTIGAEGIGIYQLIFPIYAICFSLTAAGIQTAISRLVAAKSVQNDMKSSHRILQMGLFLSLSLSAIVSVFIYTNHDFLAKNILMDYRCAPLLKILAFAIPLGSIHSCINGYYYGLKKAGVPSLSQLTEQIVRVFSVYIIYMICKANQLSTSVEIAVIGLVFGEFASMLLSITAFNISSVKEKNSPVRAVRRIVLLRSVITQSVPLTANRVLLNLLASIEAILIPGQLRSFGMNTKESLSIYGVLTGMALPLILFPSALTNSVSVMLLPTVAEAQAEKNNYQIALTIHKTVQYCTMLGIFCTGIFLTFGRAIGSVLFHTEAVGTFILTLAWICPFLYLTTTLSSIVHGLGKTTTSFIFSIISIAIRIAFVIFCIPIWGINGYLWGLLISQLLLTLLYILLIKRIIVFRFCAIDWILKPGASLLLTIFITKRFVYFFTQVNMNSIIGLLLEAIVFSITYFCCIYILQMKKQSPSHGSII